MCRIHYPNEVWLVMLVAGAVAGGQAAGQAPNPAGNKNSIEVVANVEGYETVELYAKISGYLKTIAVDIGDEVRGPCHDEKGNLVDEGQVLAELWIPEMASEVDQRKALVAQAQAELEVSRAVQKQAMAGHLVAEGALAEAEADERFRQTEHDRVKAMVDRGSLVGDRLVESHYQLEAAKAATRTARAKLDAEKANLTKVAADIANAEARVKVADANVRHAQTMMEYSRIRAPFDAVVTQRGFDPGAFIVGAGGGGMRPILTVTRTDRVRIRFDLPMVESARLKRGAAVLFHRITALPKAEFRGSVARFSGALDPRTRTRRVEVDLANDAGQSLMPGYIGYVQVELGDVIEPPPSRAQAE